MKSPTDWRTVLPPSVAAPLPPAPVLPPTPVMPPASAPASPLVTPPASDE
jgi:hypothetical protein